ENTAWHIPLRILCFLSRGRDSVKPDIGEEDDRRTRNDAAEAVRHKLSASGSSDRAADAQVVGIDEADAGDDKEHDNDHFDDHDDRVKARRFLDAAYEQQGYRDSDQSGRKIEYSVPDDISGR